MKKTTFAFVILLILIVGAQSWAQEIDALTLRDCIKIALQNNSQLRNSQNRLDLAKTSVTTAYSNILPTINSSFGSGKYIQGDRIVKGDVPVGFDPVTGMAIFEQREIVQKGIERKWNQARISLSQNIFDFGQSIYGIKQVKSLKNAAEHAVLSTRQQVVLNVKEAYYELLKAYRLREVYAEAVRQAQEEVDRAQAMMDIGISSRAEVFQAKVTLGTNRTNLINQENAVEFAKANLNNAMAIDPNTPLEIIEDKTEPIFPTYTYDEAVTSSIQNNDELKALELQMKSEFYNIRMAQTRFFPTIGASVSYSRSNDDINRVYSSELDRDYTANIGVSLDLNIFNGFADKAGVQRATLNHRIAQENLAERKRTLVVEVKQYFLALEAYKDILEINQQNIEAAQENLRLQQEKRRVGSGTELEVSQAQVELIRAQSILVRAEYDAKVVKSQLETVMGILDIEE